MGYLPFPKTVHHIIMLPETFLNDKRGFFLITTRALQVLVGEASRFKFGRQAIAYLVMCSRCFTQLFRLYDQLSLGLQEIM